MIFVSAVFVAFERWMKNPVEAHVGSGGPTSPWWHAIAAAAVGLVIQAAIVMPLVGVAHLGPGRRMIAQFQLNHFGGARLIFAADLRRTIESRGDSTELLDKTAAVVGGRLERLTGGTAITRVAGEQLIVELTERTAATLARLEQARGGDHAVLRALLAPHSLEFRIVDDDDKTITGLRELPTGVTLDWDRYAGPGDATVSSPYLRSADRAQLARFVQDRAPQGREFRLQTVRGRETFSRTYLLDRQAGLNGEYIVDARVGFDTSPAEKTRPYVQVTFNRTGAELLASMTAANVKKRMAIVLDGNVDSAPLIQTAIPGGICSIHLGGLKPVNEVLQEAKDLVLTLRGGALPVPLRLVSEERIEPRGKP